MLGAENLPAEAPVGTSLDLQCGEGYMATAPLLCMRAGEWNRPQCKEQGCAGESGRTKHCGPTPSHGFCRAADCTYGKAATHLCRRGVWQLGTCAASEWCQRPEGWRVDDGTFHPVPSVRGWSAESACSD